MKKLFVTMLFALSSLAVNAQMVCGTPPNKEKFPKICCCHGGHICPGKTGLDNKLNIADKIDSKNSLINVKVKDKYSVSQPAIIVDKMRINGVPVQLHDPVR